MSEELSRDALLIYLEDLRTLETIKYESKVGIEKVTNHTDSFRERVEDARKTEPDKPQKEPTEYVSKKDDAKWIIGGIISIVGGIISFICGVLGLGVLYIIAGILWSPIGMVIVWAKISETREAEYNNMRSATVYNHEMEDYKKKMEEYRVLVSRSVELLSKEEEKEKEFKTLLTADIQKAQEQLDKAYSVNIIPLQFRNIQGVYYLYDYISTSNQGLSEALMQCNLDAIKQKLDNVIQLQGKAIIQQAQANVAIMKQNQQILETAQATMQNTAVAAKYAQIAAVNSTLALQLDSKQLAYQKANFWLK
ncbi:hypothetical protein [Ruminococcus sp.]